MLTHMDIPYLNLQFQQLGLQRRTIVHKVLVYTGVHKQVVYGVDVLYI